MIKNIVILLVLFLFTMPSCISNKVVPFKQIKISKVNKINLPEGIVILYSTSWCYWCERAKEFLIENDIPYIEKDFDNKEVKEQLYLIAKQVGYKGSVNAVPLFIINEKIIIGYNPVEILHVLERSSGKASKTSIGMSVVYE